MSKEYSSQFDPSRYVKQGVPIELVQQMKSAFDLFDVQQAGSISAKELQAAMDSFGFQSKNRAIYLMISQLNSDGNSEIDFDQWISLMTPKAPITNIRAHYSKVFELYDDQKTGFITAKNIKRVAEDLGMVLTDRQIQQMIARADQDQDGGVSEEEFYQILTYRK